MKFTLKLKLARHKRLTFLGGVLLLVAMIAGGEAFALTHESTSPDGYFGHFYTAPPNIYSQGDLGSRSLINEDAPTIHGQPYNVVYYKAGLVAPLETIYYHVPQDELDMTPGYPCPAPQLSMYNFFRVHCTDPRTLPGTRRVAVKYSGFGAYIEILTVLGAFGAVGMVYWRYIRR